MPDYLACYRAARGDDSLSPKDESHIKSALNKLYSLPGTYSFTVLQLVPDMTEEEVSQIFVRVNSMGKRLNHADFILTLMSVYWDTGRHELERFARESRMPPAAGAKVPFNFKWTHIDFERGFITLKGEEQEGAKSSRDERIPLTQPVRELLAEICGNGSAYVFPGRDGVSRMTDINKQVNTIKKAANLPAEFRPLHGLRHTFASVAVSNGVPLSPCTEAADAQGSLPDATICSP